MKKNFKGIRKKEIGSLQNIIYMSLRERTEQRDVVIPNELGNGETCQGLRHWRLLSNLKNNFSKPVRNDMGRHTEDGSPKYLHTLGSRFFAFAQNDGFHSC